MRTCLLAATLLPVSASASEHRLHQGLADSGALHAPAPTSRWTPPPADRRPDARVYGYVAYWADNLDTVRWDALTDVALFTATATPDGRLTQTSRWGDVSGALRRAAPYGVRVHLTVANFDPDELRSLLGQKSARDALIAALAAEVGRTGAHGVNVDFEGVPADRRAELVTFTRDLARVVPEVVLATPAVDWSGAWDYAALSRDADLFIMGYGYHWSGSEQAGPVDPLFGGTPWSKWSLDWTLKDYRSKGAAMDRVILGLPLYGYAWKTSGASIPSTATSKGEVVFYDDHADRVARHGRRLEGVSRSPWTWDGSTQAWASDADSVRERAQYAMDEQAGGIGFWALNYEAGDPALWQAVLDVTDLPAEDTGLDAPDDTDPSEDETDVPDGDTDSTEDVPLVASAGRPFFAYPGETVQLSAAWSTGPAPLVYRWVQVAGPPVLLDDATAQEPRFKAKEPGVHAFEVTVGSGGRYSVPAVSRVVVIERDLAPGCACEKTAAPVTGLAFLAPLLAVVRRRRR